LFLKALLTHKSYHGNVVMLLKPQSAINTHTKQVLKENKGHELIQDNVIEENVVPLGYLICEADRAIQDLCAQISTLQLAKDQLEKEKAEALKDVATAKQKAEDLVEQLGHAGAHAKKLAEEDIAMKTQLWKQKELVYREELTEMKQYLQETQVRLQELQKNHLSDMQEKEERLHALQLQTHGLEHECQLAKSCEERYEILIRERYCMNVVN
jgi:chromosome segregation ATPase